MTAPDAIDVARDALAANEREVEHRHGIGARWPTFPKLTDAERDHVHTLLARFADEHEERAEQHAHQLERLTRRLGGQVARGEITVADATDRIESFAYAYDRDCPVPLGILHRDHATEILLDAFARGVREERGER